MAFGIALALGGISAIGGIGSSIIGGLFQNNAANKAIGAEQGMFNTAYNALYPYINNGETAWSKLAPLIGLAPGTNPKTAQLTAPFSAATLPSTPGYQFSLSQGLKGTQSGYAAEGLGSSGAAEKGGAQFAQGLAQNTYQQQFQNYLAQNQQIYNMLYGPYAQGAGAASSLGGLATNTGGQLGSTLVGQGNALAGAAGGVGQSIAGGANTVLQYNLLQQLLASRNNPAATVNNANPFWPSTSSYSPGGPFQDAYSGV